MIGVLISDYQLRQVCRGRRSHEVISFYIEAGHEVGEQVLFFSPGLINQSDKTLKCFNGSTFIQSGIPPIVINRIRSTQQQDKAAVDFLKTNGAYVFNSENVLSKWDTHDMLKNAREIKPYLPETQLFTHAAFETMLTQHPMLFLKPTALSLGIGILKVTTDEKGIRLIGARQGKMVSRRVSGDDVVRLINRRKGMYLIQQGIPLMRYTGRLVDYRVSVQKNATGEWQMTGMVGKVGQAGGIVTNLHGGGRAVKAHRLFETWGWNREEVVRVVENLSLCIAQTLSQKDPDIADIGLDIGFDQDGQPWFFEANLRDLRVTFRDAREQHIWKETFKNPVRYAAHLLQDRRC